MSDEPKKAEPGKKLAAIAPLVVVLLLALHAGLAWLSREPGVLTGQDDAEYITLARSLLQGGYNDLFRVDAPPHRTYPPVYPAAIAGWSLIAGSGTDSLAILNILFSVAMLAVLFAGVRRLAGDGLALLTVALLAINPVLIEYAGGVRSEPLFTLFAVIALVNVLSADGVRAAQAKRREEYVAVGRRPPPPRDTQYVVIAILSALLAALTRSVGVTLVAALALHWLFQKRWLLVGIPMAFAVGAIGIWLFWTARQPDMFVGSSYIAELKLMWTGTEVMGPLPSRMLHAVRWYTLGGIPWVLSFPSIAGTPIDNAATEVFFGGLGLAGLVVMFRRWRVAAFWLVLYAALLLVWVFLVDRFVEPTLPILLVTILIGGREIGRHIGKRGDLVLPAIAAIVLAVGAGVKTTQLAQSRVNCDRSGEYPDPQCMSEDQRSYFDALRWIDANTAPDAVFLTAKPGALYLYTGRKSIFYDEAINDSADTFLADTRGAGADWILLDSVHSFEARLLAPLLEQNCGALRVEAEFPPRAWLFRIVGTGTAPNRGPACDAVARYRAANRGNTFGARTMDDR